MSSKEIKDMTLEEALREVLESKEDINSVIDALNYVSIPALNYIIEKNALEYYEAGDILPDDHPHTILTHHHGGMSRLLKKVRELEDENHTNYGMFIAKTGEVSKLTLEIKALKDENETINNLLSDKTDQVSDLKEVIEVRNQYIEEMEQNVVDLLTLKDENEKLKSDNHDLTTEILYANDREKSLKEKNEKLLHCYNSINNRYDVEKAKMVNDMNKLKALQEGQELILSWIKYMDKFRG
jgi:hypothetical protein